MRPSSSTTLGGRYGLTERIAVGGMGEVWKAKDKVLGRTVAVKILKEEYTGDPGFLERFRAEARHTALLNHPGVANVFDYGETPDYNGGDPLAYLVMELVDGEPLNSVISRLGRLSLTNTLDMLEQTGRALQAAHSQGLVHRDVKPGNVLLDATRTRACLGDLGSAARLDNTGHADNCGGTLLYLDPAAKPSGQVTVASDLYGLGVTLSEMLTGRYPYESINDLEVASRLARGLRSLPDSAYELPPRRLHPSLNS